jgi:hypothetical protein
MKKLKTIILTTLTAVILATPAFATQPESPVCNPRNCDHAAQSIEMPDPECVGKECEVSHSVDELKPLCRYPNCRPSGS